MSEACNRCDLITQVNQLGEAVDQVHTDKGVLQQKGKKATGLQLHLTVSNSQSSQETGTAQNMTCYV